MSNEKMIQSQIISRGVNSFLVLKAMRSVDRKNFVTENMKYESYQDRPLPIGFGQTISQPYIVAFMTEALQLSPGMKVLEIGTGSGYQTAVLAECGVDVYTVENVSKLAVIAKNLLNNLGYSNIHFKEGSGYEGWEEFSPYDRIIVTCAPEDVPEKLLLQLSENGIMIIPRWCFYASS
jgi:protein-L-isoaspartate(D-aspartate) O-methyltransferase